MKLKDESGGYIKRERMRLENESENDSCDTLPDKMIEAMRVSLNLIGKEVVL